MIQKLKFVGVIVIACLIPACGSPEPAGPVTPFKIGAIADCQYADKDTTGNRIFRSSPEKLTEAVGVMNEFDLSFVVHLGDFIEEDWESYGTLNEITAGLDHPLRHVVGNHEYHVADDKKADVHKVLGMPGRYYSFEHGDWVFAVVDGNDLSYHGWPKSSERYRESTALHRSQYPDKFTWNGAMGEEQIQWLDNLMARADRDGKRVVVFSHFPVFPDHDLNLWNADDVSAVFESHPSATAWINGHNHDGAYAERNGIHYITLNAMLDTERNAFSILEFHDDKLLLSGFGRQRDMELTLR